MQLINIIELMGTSQDVIIKFEEKTYKGNVLDILNKYTLNLEEEVYRLEVKQGTLVVYV